MSPSVDIILPNYNKAKFLDEAIKSVITQTYKNWNLYIVDDCSSDDSLKIINNYSNLNNVHIVKLNKNKGPAFCRNYAMRISKSKYISFIDSDDIWTKNKLETQIIFMDKENINFSYTDYTPFFQNGDDKKFKKRTHIRDYFNFETFINNSSINTSTMIIARSILSTHRFKKINLCEDYLFKCKLLKKNNFAKKINKNSAYYRILSGSRSSRRLKNVFWLWHINRKFNKLNFIRNIISIFFISLNSIRKYGGIK